MSKRAPFLMPNYKQCGLYYPQMYNQEQSSCGYTQLFPSIRREAPSGVWGMEVGVTTIRFDHAKLDISNNILSTSLQTLQMLKKSESFVTELSVPDPALRLLFCHQTTGGEGSREDCSDPIRTPHLRLACKNSIPPCRDVPGSESRGMDPYTDGVLRNTSPLGRMVNTLRMRTNV